ncbi:MAG: hypothetical protein NTZ26_12085, partial [Candidatus Aminicenantes bacterium]|nr:hypothetical protein [Candidatus Aminicenantes bacterium]
SLRRLGNGRIDVRTSKTQMIYELDPKTLACLDLVFSSTFRSLHEKAALAGITQTVLGDAYGEKLKRGFLYWTGREWTSTPSWAVRRP